MKYEIDAFTTLIELIVQMANKNVSTTIFVDELCKSAPYITCKIPDESVMGYYKISTLDFDNLCEKLYRKLHLAFDNLVPKYYFDNNNILQYSLVTNGECEIHILFPTNIRHQPWINSMFIRDNKNENIAFTLRSN